MKKYKKITIIWMAMALVYGAVGCQTVEILVAFDVPYPATLAPRNDYIEGLVVMCAVFVLE